MRVARRVGYLGRGVADERQIGVEGAGPAHAPADASRPALDGGADGLTVEAELGRDGAELPVLAVIEAPDLGALRGRDHRPSPSERRRAPASGPATGSAGRRPHSAWAQAREPGRRRERGVCPTAGVRGKCDPSHDAGRGGRVAGRGGRGALRGCADGGRWRLEPPGGDRPPGTAACSRPGRGNTPRRRRRVGGSVGRSSGGGAGPRRRSARGGLRLDNEPEPWHTTAGTGSVCRSSGRSRGSGGTTGPSPPTSESAPYAIRTHCRSPAPGLWTPPLPMDAKSAPTGSLENREERGFPQRPQPSFSSSSRSTRETGTGAGRTGGCRELISFSRLLTATGHGAAALAETAHGGTQRVTHRAPGPSHAPPPPCAGRIVAGPGAPDGWNRGSHAAPDDRQDGGAPRIGGGPPRAARSLRRRKL